MNDTFGYRLRFYRTSLGLTQQQLSDKSGVSRKQISDFEKEIQTNPRPQTLFKLADALGVSFTDLRPGVDTNISEAEALKQNRSAEITIELPKEVLDFYEKRALENGTSVDDEIYLAVRRNLTADVNNIKSEHRSTLNSEILEKLNKLEQDLKIALLKTKHNKT